MPYLPLFKKICYNEKKELILMKKGIYKHYKGNEYEVIGTAIHSETLEKMVIYKALYRDGKTWVRPINMWDEEVEINGKMVKRFELIKSF